MNRREFIGSLGGAASALSQTRQTPPDRPNIIWLLGDQHRGQALGMMGDPNAATPNMDVLSRTGVHFTNAVSGMPLCCPFRGSMLTGRYPHHCVPGHQYPLPEGQPTIARPFRDAGYHTGYFGKWHLDGFKEGVQGRAGLHIVPPNRRGEFDTWVGYENNNSQWDTWVHGGVGKDAFHYRLPGYETDELTTLFIKYLRERGEQARSGKRQPFFAVLSVQPPHDPFVAPPEYMRYNPARLELRPNVPASAAIQGRARRELAGYYAQLANWDANIGRIRQTLTEIGLAFNTHTLFFSDHGEMAGSHGQFRKMTPHEESIRIPFIISGGQAEYSGWRTGRPAAPLNHVDIAPTTLGLAGIARPSWMEGTDYSHLRAGWNPQPASLPDSAYLQSVVPTMHNESVNKPWRGLVTRDGWKYVCFSGLSWLMFNLNEDPYEQVNLAHNEAFKAERTKLIARLRQWVADTRDRFDVPEN